jgi:hypothetical protein
VGAAVVNGEHLNVLVIAATVSVFVLEPKVGEVDLIIEVRQVMFQCPRADFLVEAIGMPVVVVALCIVLVQPLLIVPLQLVIENDAVNSRALFVEVVRCVEVRIEDLCVVFELSRPFEARVIGLAVILAAIKMSLQKLTASLG